MSKPKKTKNKQSRKTIQNRMDKIWSLLVRERAGHKCERCGSGLKYRDYLGKDGVDRKMPYGIDAHHIIQRSMKLTRWSLDNGVALCHGCHKWNGAHSEHYLVQLKYHAWISLYFNTHRAGLTFPSISNMVDVSTVCGSKDLPMSTIRDIDEHLKSLVSDLK